jgi:hypothetical protein
MSLGAYSAPDPQVQGLNTNGLTANVTTTGLTLRSPALVPGQRTLTLITIGQSNSANHQGDSPYLFDFTASNVDMVHMRDGRVFQAKEPLLGADGTMSNYISRVANDLVVAGDVDRVILMCCGAGGTYMREHDPVFVRVNPSDGPYHPHLTNAVSRAKSMGLLTTPKSACVIMTQGESDAQIATTQAAWEQALYRIRASIDTLGFPGPIFVNKATWVNGLPSNSAAIRAAQAGVVNGTTIRAGFDMDTLDNSLRYDDVHLSAAGAQAKANGVRSLLNAWLAS